MMLRIPVPNAPPDLAEKVETALLGQVSEIADQVCNGVLVTSAAAPLKNSDRLGSPGDVVSFIGHLSPRNTQSLNDEYRLMATSVHAVYQPFNRQIATLRTLANGNRQRDHGLSIFIVGYHGGLIRAADERKQTLFILTQMRQPYFQVAQNVDIGDDCEMPSTALSQKWPDLPRRITGGAISR